MDWLYGKTYINICLHVVLFLETISFCQRNKCLISVNMSPLSDFFERVKFYEWPLKFSLTAKGINVPGMATTSHTNILRISEIRMFFSNSYEIIGGQQQHIFVMFDLKDTPVFMYEAAIHIYFTCEGNWMKIGSLNEKFCSVRILFTNVTFPLYMSPIIGVLNCSL